MKINIKRVRLELLETARAYEDKKMLPRPAESFQESCSRIPTYSGESFQESGARIPLYLIETTLKELSAEGLIRGTEIGDKSYLVTEITDDGREELTGTRKRRDELTGRLLTNNFRDEDEDKAKIYIERLKVGLLEKTWVYGKEQMLPKQAEAFLESQSLIPLWMVESALKELNAEGLIDGTEMRNKNYMVTGITVTGITDAGLETLKSSGRLFRLKRRYK